VEYVGDTPVAVGRQHSSVAHVMAEPMSSPPVTEMARAPMFAGGVALIAVGLQFAGAARSRSKRLGTAASSPRRIPLGHPDARRRSGGHPQESPQPSADGTSPLPGKLLTDIYSGELDGPQSQRPEPDGCGSYRGAAVGSVGRLVRSSACDAGDKRSGRVGIRGLRRTVAQWFAAFLFLGAGLLTLWPALLSPRSASSQQMASVFPVGVMTPSGSLAALGPGVGSGRTTVPPGVTVQRSGLLTRRIADIRPGMRVLADNPEVTQHERQNAIEPDPSWRHLHLEMDKADGTLLKIELLRPRAWLAANAATLGATIHLDLEEMGASGPARVVHIGPAPPLEAGPGQIVTGTFAHSAANVINLYVEGLDEPIGTTASHPFWCEDRQAFVPAGDLKSGERLRTQDGQLLDLTASRPRAAAAVFNLEVNTEHVYYVGIHGLLVHNSCDGKGVAPKSVVNPRLKLRREKWRAYRARKIAAGETPLDMRRWVKATQGQSWGSGFKSNFRAWSKSVGNTHLHHGFPQQFRSQFSRIGIEADDFLYPLNARHHLARVHAGAGGGRYNQFWQEFFAGRHGPITKDNAIKLLDGLSAKDFIVP